MAKYFAILILIILQGCEFLSMERTPSSSDVLAWTDLHPFILNKTNVHGVYQNLDIDSMVFYYEASAYNDASFWNDIMHSSSSEHWKETGKRGVFRIFERYDGPRGSNRIYSSEQIRIYFDSKRRVAKIAYVQIDGMGKPVLFADNDTQIRFANKKLWPKFMELIER